jgi:Tol biopolymer transport system component
VAGGPSQIVCDAPLGKGGTWSADNVIVFSPGTLDGLYRVPAAGGSTTQLTTPDQSLGEDSHRWPWFLPDGRHFLYTARNSVQEKTTIYVGDLESPNPKATDRRRLLTVNSNVVYAAPGLLLYMRDRALMAQPFNAGRAQITGDPFAVEQADYLPFFALGAFSVSRNGVLACYSGNSAKKSQIAWFDRSGKPLGPVGDPGEFFKPATPPDGSRLAVDRLDEQAGTYDIWLHDLVRGTGSRITYDSRQDLFPVWSPDGNQVVFASNRHGQFDLYRMPANGPGSEQVLLKSPLMKFPCDWSRDGRYLIYRQDDPKTKEDLWVLPDPGGALESQKPFAYLQSEFNEQWAKLSPDLRWLAYTSDETGRNEVYVQTFPTPGAKAQISTEGGSRPVWRADGNELFYIAADQKMMAVDVKTGSKFAAGAPKPLFETHVEGDRFFEISPDGRRFLLVNLPDQTAGTPMTVVIDWNSGAKK